MTPPFRYQPLKQEDDEFRLLKLIPANDDAQVSCELVHKSLSSPPPYTALSYTWQDPINGGNELGSSDIRLGGRPFSVGKNLENALLELHY